MDFDDMTIIAVYPKIIIFQPLGIFNHSTTSNITLLTTEAEKLFVLKSS